MIKSTLAIALFCIGCTGPQVAGPKAPVATSSDWVVAPNARSIVLGETTGGTITLVPIISPSDQSKVNHFLLQAISTGSKHDGLVIIVEKLSLETATIFVSQIDAEPYGLLVHSRAKNRWTFKGYEYIERDLELVVMDTPIDPAGLLALRKTQEQGSRLAKLEPATLAQKRAAHERNLAKAAKTETSCGKVATTIDWTTTNEADFETFSVSGRCRVALNRLEEFCDQYPTETAPLKNSLSLTCKLNGDSKEGKLSITDGTHIQFTVGEKSAVAEPWDAFLDAWGGRVQALRVGDQEFVAKVGKKLTFYRKNQDTYYPVARASRKQNVSVAVHEGVTSSSINLNSGEWTLHCNQDRHPIEILTGTERQAVLAQAKYAEQPLWSREPYFLARDLQGLYYYVDRYKKTLGGKRYRVFVGRRGQLKLTKLKRVVEDSEGTLFSTDSGDLRLVVNASRRHAHEAIWLSNKKKTNLTAVFIPDNAKLVYDELGVYYGEDLGLVCQ